MTLGILPGKQRHHPAAHAGLLTHCVDGKLPHVPGTVLLDDVAAHAEGAAGLKHGRGHIVLNPQPSEDPNDPLNWPHWKKEVITAILCLGAVLHAGTNVCLPPVYDHFQLTNCRVRYLMPPTSPSQRDSAHQSPTWSFSLDTISSLPELQVPCTVHSVEDTVNDPAF